MKITSLGLTSAKKKKLAELRQKATEIRCLLKYYSLEKINKELKELYDEIEKLNAKRQEIIDKRLNVHKIKTIELNARLNENVENQEKLMVSSNLISKLLRATAAVKLAEKELKD